MIFSLTNRIASLTLAIALPSFAAAEATVHEVGGTTVELLLQSQFVEDTGAANRIEAGDILRTVSQEIPSAVCHLHNGVSTDTSIALLNEGVAKFDLMMDALMNGNSALGIIGGEERRKTRVLMEEIQTIWEPFRASAISVRENPADNQSLGVIYDHATKLLELTSLLLSELEGEYANPVELLQSDVMLLEVAGRQSMMTQRMSYLACRVWSGSADDAYIADLGTTAQQFNFAMTAMRNGMPEVGINPPPTEEIASLLEVAASDWDVVTGHLDAISATGNPGEAVTSELYEMLADKMHKMEEIAHLYAEFSKRVY